MGRDAGKRAAGVFGGGAVGGWGLVAGAGKIFVYRENPTAVLAKAPLRSMLNDPLRPGERRVEALDATFSRRSDDDDDPYWVPGWRKHLEEKYPPESVKHMRILLDAVILEDGVLSGPDECRFAKHFSKYVSKERKIFRGIVKSVDAGKSLESTIQGLANPKGLAEDDCFCTVQSPAEAHGLWKRDGDEAFLRLAREMAGGGPFSVRRRNLRP